MGVVFFSVRVVYIVKLDTSQFPRPRETQTHSPLTFHFTLKSFLLHLFKHCSQVNTVWLKRKHSRTPTVEKEKNCEGSIWSLGIPHTNTHVCVCMELTSRHRQTDVFFPVSVNFWKATKILWFWNNWRAVQTDM